MIDFSEAQISKLIVHRISSDARMSSVNDKLYDYQNDDDAETLKKVFLKPFVNVSTTNEFKHPIDLELNPLFKISEAIYDGEDFVKRSKDIFTYLESVSKHPNIKDGDLFIAKYDDVKLDNTFYEALGIYKIENKENFIDTRVNEDRQVVLEFRKGIGARKLDKACLILFTEEPFTVFSIDNGSSETDYWKNEFLNIDLKKDDINSTSHFLNITKSFVTEKYAYDDQNTRADQIDLLNRSVNFFKNNEVFEKKDFEREVLQNDNIIESFRSFDSNYRSDRNLDLSDSFQISQQAVKKQVRALKRVLKLDKNFDIYIHGDRQLIESGVEKDGRKYYKIYYDQES